MSAVIKNEIARIAAIAGTKFMSINYPYLLPDIKGCIRGVTFLWGHPIEVVKTLQDYTNHEDLRYEKFPLIALFTDIPVSKYKYGDYDGVSLRIIIANGTLPTYDSPTREDKNFIPVLRPIFNHFITALKKSSVFSFVDEMSDLKYDYVERYYWGREGLYGNAGNIYNDHVDAIEIRNLELKVNAQCLTF